MNKLAAGLVFCLAAFPLVASAGEGNGPDFPGMQTPSVGITTSSDGTSHVYDTMRHSADSGFLSRTSRPAVYRRTPLTQQQLHTWQMLQSNTAGG